MNLFDIMCIYIALLLCFIACVFCDVERGFGGNRNILEWTPGFEGQFTDKGDGKPSDSLMSMKKLRRKRGEEGFHPPRRNRVGDSEGKRIHKPKPTLIGTGADMLKSSYNKASSLFGNITDNVLGRSADSVTIKHPVTGVATTYRNIKTDYEKEDLGLHMCNDPGEAYSAAYLTTREHMLFGKSFICYYLRSHAWLL